MRERESGGLPHVTDLLSQVGLIDQQWFQEYDLTRGTAVHRAAEYLDQGDLDWDSVDPAILGRIRAYQRFLDEVRPEILSVEEKVEHKVYRYCGTLDRRVVIKGREGVLDIKGPSRAPWQALQVALYAATFSRPLARWTLHLSDDGYRLIEHKDRSDYGVAFAAVTLAAWREANGA